jgi:lipopolysaccharide biosynthesis protein
MTVPDPGVTPAADVRVVAFYLPQFHPFPENDAWWGKGFTEWTNVTRAQPLFVGHYQPHLPADLGFYDLRVPEVRHAQVAMARAAGIDGFCYHFYWFSGKRLLERPLDDMLADRDLDMPFCLCWANENWTRRWDASEHEILIAQKYLPGDAVASLQAMEKYLRDPRYMTVDGRKVIVVYRPQHLPQSQVWMDAWRQYAREAGLGELYLVCALTHGNWSYTEYGFDGGVEFPPHNVGERTTGDLTKQLGLRTEFRGACVDFHDAAEFYLTRDRGAESNVFRTVYPSWDNTARRKERALVTMNGTPANYEYWLHRAIEATRQDFPGQDRLVFVNAWNEWAEGCHLEPDQRFGHGFLEATRRARAGSRLTGWTDVGVPPECDDDAQKAEVAHLAAILTKRFRRKSLLRRLAHGFRDTSRAIRGKKRR